MNDKQKFAEEWFWKQPKFENKPRFHFEDGVWFIRMKNRSVTILQVKFFPETNSVPDDQCEWNPKLYFEMEIPVLSWCSILAAMSLEGSNADSYKKATELHGFNLPPAVHQELLK